MASQWYYAVGDAEHGPIPSQELKRLVDTGQIKPTDQVWKEGMAQWADAGSIPNLFSVSAPAPASVSSASGSAPNIDTGMAGSPFIASNETSPTQRFTSRPAGSRTSSGAGNVAKQASNDALSAFKLIASDPVGGLADAYNALGSSRALQAGIVFGLVVALCPTIGAGVLMKTIMSLVDGAPRGPKMELEIYLKIFFSVLLLPLTFSGGCALSRVIFGGKNGYESDLFIASASLLPLSLTTLLAGLIGEALGPQVIVCLLIFALSTTILMLFSGITRIHNITDRAATLAVPITIVVGFIAFYFVMKVIFLSR